MLPRRAVLLTPSITTRLSRPSCGAELRFRTTNPLPVAHYCFKSFSCNTYGSPRKCCKQKTYGQAKPFRCNTYKKQGWRSSSWELATRHSSVAIGLKSFLFTFLRTLLHFFASAENSTRFFSIDYALLAQNTRGMGYSQRSNVPTFNDLSPLFPHQIG